jgi:hypothetical protein
MSLFQCEHCGCVDNTALCCNGIQGVEDWFDWTGIEGRIGLRLCSACAPPRDCNGKGTGYGVWHNEFDRVFLPKGEFHTNPTGNLARRLDGDTDYKKWEIKMGI